MDFTIRFPHSFRVAGDLGDISAAAWVAGSRRPLLNVLTRSVPGVTLKAPSKHLHSELPLPLP
jgi:hypothetical protein